jgi:hypothetical protein
VGGCAARITPHRPAGDHRRRRSARTSSAVVLPDPTEPHQLLAPATSLSAPPRGGSAAKSFLLSRATLLPPPATSASASAHRSRSVRSIHNPVDGRGWAADQIPAARTWSRRWIGVADQIYARDLAVGRWSAW